MVTISDPLVMDALKQLIAEIIDLQCWDPLQNHRLTHNMCFRREDSLKKAEAILALIKELV